MNTSTRQSRFVTFAPKEITVWPIKAAGTAKPTVNRRVVADNELQLMARSPHPLNDWPVIGIMVWHGRAAGYPGLLSEWASGRVRLYLTGRSRLFRPTTEAAQELSKIQRISCDHAQLAIEDRLAKWPERQFVGEIVIRSVESSLVGHWVTRAVPFCLHKCRYKTEMNHLGSHCTSRRK